MTAYLWMVRGVGFAVLLQSLEMMRLQNAWGARGIWQWNSMRSEFKVFGEKALPLLDRIYSPRGFGFLLVIQAICTLVMIADPQKWQCGIAALATLLISIRWRGVFNGGSDAMTLSLLIGLAVLPVYGALLFCTFQVTFSYVVAGWVKLKEKSWRDGTALQHFLQSQRYSIPSWVSEMSRKPLFCMLASWGVILFELGSPLALFSSQWILPFLLIGGLFHLANYYVFGLNRFFWIWVAGYPALYWFANS